MDGDDQACSTQRAAVPDLAAGTLPMEAGSSTVPGPMTGMEIDVVALQLPQAEVFSDEWWTPCVGGWEGRAGRERASRGVLLVN